jgi:hypothetical protein
MATAPLPGGEQASESAPLISASEAEALPTSFGVFNPIGHVMLGVPSSAQAQAMVSELHAAGWVGESVRQFSPTDTVAEFQAMVDDAGSLAGFGYEITLSRRYLALALEGHHWLLVKVADLARATEAAEMARSCGATIAVYYRLLTVEELIP